MTSGKGKATVTARSVVNLKPEMWGEDLLEKSTMRLFALKGMSHYVDCGGCCTTDIFVKMY